MLKKLIGHKIASVVSAHKWAILGGVLTIGSIGLLMGAVTCGVSVLLMTFGGMEMVPAMAVGFFSTGFASLLLGVLLLLHGGKK